MTKTIKLCKNTRKLIFNDTNKIYKLELANEKFYCDESPVFYDTYDVILGIIEINNVKHLVYVKESELAHNIIYSIKNVRVMHLPFQGSTQEQTEITLQIKNFMESHHFYYSYQKIEGDEFLWNNHMQSHFREYKISSSLVEEEDFEEWSDEISEFPLANLYCGYCSTNMVENYIMSVTSLISSNRIGPRFYCRGVNDQGDVSFFVKTDTQLIQNNDVIYNRSIIRGSIPLFWYQDKNPLRSSTKYSRERDVSQMAFEKHFERLKSTYNNIFVINLLGSKDSESELTEAYIKLLDQKKIKYINFDMNKHFKDFENLRKLFYEILDDIDEDHTFRVNCLDCMDRTNICQYLINEYYLTKNTTLHNKAFTECLGKLFSENGHALSNFYCGADSLKSELTTKGKRSYAGVLDDLYINASRLISGSFNDKTKQNIINTMLEKNTEVKSDTNRDVESCRNDQFFILSWCINNTKFSESNKLDIKNQGNENTLFAIICLQKIKMSYKKLLMDKKQEEREKWTVFFEKELSGANYILISQNFHRDIGTLLFVKKNILEMISDIKPFKFRQNMLNGNISVITNFVYKNRVFTINNSVLLINKDIYKNDSETVTHMRKIRQTSDYTFLTGYFDSDMIINSSDYEYFVKKFDYERLIVHDFLNSNMHLLNGFAEGEITFLPTGDLHRKDKIPKYATRIFTNENIQNDTYTDILYYATGYRPVYGLFTIKK